MVGQVAGRSLPGLQVAVVRQAVAGTSPGAGRSLLCPRSLPGRMVVMKPGPGFMVPYAVHQAGRQVVLYLPGPVPGRQWQSSSGPSQ